MTLESLLRRAGMPDDDEDYEDRPFSIRVSAVEGFKLDLILSPDCVLEALFLFKLDPDEQCRFVRELLMLLMGNPENRVTLPSEDGSSTITATMLCDDERTIIRLDPEEDT